MPPLHCREVRIFPRIFVWLNNVETISVYRYESVEKCNCNASETES